MGLLLPRSCYQSCEALWNRDSRCSSCGPLSLSLSLMGGWNRVRIFSAESDQRTSGMERVTRCASENVGTRQSAEQPTLYAYYAYFSMHSMHSVYSSRSR